MMDSKHVITLGFICVASLLCACGNPVDQGPCNVSPSHGRETRSFCDVIPVAINNLRNVKSTATKLRREIATVLEGLPSCRVEMDTQAYLSDLYDITSHLKRRIKDNGNIGGNGHRFFTGLQNDFDDLHKNLHSANCHISTGRNTNMQVVPPLQEMTSDCSENELLRSLSVAIEVEKKMKTIFENEDAISQMCPHFRSTPF